MLGIASSPGPFLALLKNWESLGTRLLIIKPGTILIDLACGLGGRGLDFMMVQSD